MRKTFRTFSNLNLKILRVGDGFVGEYSEHRPPRNGRNPDPSIARLNALQSCLPTRKRPRSPGLLQSSHSRAYLPDFIPTTASPPVEDLLMRWHTTSLTLRTSLTPDAVPSLPPWFLISSPYLYPITLPSTTPMGNLSCHYPHRQARIPHKNETPWIINKTRNSKMGFLVCLLELPRLRTGSLNTDKWR